MSKKKQREDSDGKPITVVIETPRGCRNKFKYDFKTHELSLSSVLPAGAVFPYDFGFVPETVADDGDPLDVLLLMDTPVYPGCKVTARLVGVIEAEQAEGLKTVRNDRLLAVATEAHDYRDVRSPDDINGNLLAELEHFFTSYNAIKGRKFTLLGLRGPKQARKTLKAASKKARS